MNGLLRKVSPWKQALWSTVLWNVCFGFAVPVPVSWSQDEQQDLVSLEQVLQSTETHHPQIRQSLFKARAAQAKTMQASGAFDPKLRAKGIYKDGGYYNLAKVDVELRQPTPLWGLELWAGYRYGRQLEDGNLFPTYDAGETLSSGELRAGVEVPIWRNGPIDERRAAREQAALDLGAADNRARFELLLTKTQAVQSYGRWLSTLAKWEATEKQFELSKTRVSQVKRKQELGAASDIEVLEAERAQLIFGQAANQLQQSAWIATNQLGLFLRNAQGQPQSIKNQKGSMEALESIVVKNADVEWDTLMSELLEFHPELMAMRQSIQAEEVQLSLLENRISPELSLQFEVSRDFGNTQKDPTLGGTVYEAKASFSMPLLLRKERGEAQALREELEGQRTMLRFQEEKLQVSMRNLRGTLELAQLQAEQTQALANAAERLAEAERVRMAQGVSDGLRVTLREQSAQKARIEYFDALSKWFVMHESLRLLREVVQQSENGSPKGIR